MTPKKPANLAEVYLCNPFPLFPFLQQRLRPKPELQEKQTVSAMEGGSWSNALHLRL